MDNGLSFKYVRGKNVEIGTRNVLLNLYSIAVCTLPFSEVLKDLKETKELSILCPKSDFKKSKILVTI